MTATSGAATGGGDRSGASGEGAAGIGVEAASGLDAVRSGTPARVGALGGVDSRAAVEPPSDAGAAAGDGPEFAAMTDAAPTVDTGTTWPIGVPAIGVLAPGVLADAAADAASAETLAGGNAQSWPGVGMVEEPGAAALPAPDVMTAACALGAADPVATVVGAGVRPMTRYAVMLPATTSAAAAAP